jgi:uncharacterized membrane protein YfcA
MLVLGGALAAVAAFLAGASGFGLGLVATPLLLLSGFSLPFVVTVNLLISLASGSGLRAFLWWLPGVLVANAVGMLVGLRLPENTFRRTTLALAFAAGVATAATA